jgi:hypothetical protein
VLPDGGSGCMIEVTSPFGAAGSREGDLGRGVSLDAAMRHHARHGTGAGRRHATEGRDRMETTARRTRAAFAVAIGLVAALALPALALAADGESAPPSPVPVGVALGIICVLAVVLFLFGLLGVRGAATDARVEHDAKE